jgi:hypothetical protein
MIPEVTVAEFFFYPDVTSGLINGSLQLVATAMADAADKIPGGGFPATVFARGAISRAAYSTFYYTSFGVVFPTLFVLNLVPGFGAARRTRATQDAASEL